MIIDTHCHLDDERFSDDLDEVLRRARKRGVGRFIIPGADPATLHRAVAIAEAAEDIYFAVGVHPYDAPSYDKALLEGYITHEKCVAVGECGLDYYRLPESGIEEYKRLQKSVFVSQMELSCEYDKPLIVHIRDASADSLELLREHAGKRGGVLHCYNAATELLNLAQRGFYYGIGGVLTFKNARKLIDIFPKIPIERLLIETDAPYLSPHPYRGQRNEPAYCVEIAQKMAELRDMSFEEICEISTANCKRLFGI